MAGAPPLPAGGQGVSRHCGGGVRSYGTVVQACATWLVHHPYLLGDKECLATVVEVAELGVSGSKSQQKASDPPVMKVGLGCYLFLNFVPKGIARKQCCRFGSGIRCLFDP